MKERQFGPARPRDAAWGERYFYLHDPNGHELSFCPTHPLRLPCSFTLSTKRGIPPSGNAGTTRWAATLRSEVVARDEIPVTLDEKLPTLRASGVLPVADHAWQVPGIDVTQACPLADLCCMHQRLGAGVLRVCHFVIFVKGRYMPRNIQRHACQKLGQASQFVVGVVKPRNHQRNDLQPEAHLV